MIFEIINPNLSSVDTLEKQSILTALLRSHGLRKNALVASKQFIEKIVSCDDYGVPDKLYATDILDQRRDLLSLKNSLSFYLRIDFDNEDLGTYQVEEKNITISYKYFKEIESCGACLFVGENESDVRFYSILADYYKKFIVRNKAVQISFTSVHGGGSTTSIILDGKKEIYPSGLAIIDSDKRHPNGQLGSTALSMNECDRFKVKILPVQEAENLIPNLVISDLISKETNHVDNFDIVNRMISQFPESKIYFDHKGGMTLKKAIELDIKYGEYWIPIFSYLGLSDGKQCLPDKHCSNCDNCPTINGFGGAILNNAIDNMVGRNTHSIFSGVDDDVKGFWRELGELLYTYGCGGIGGEVRS